MKTFLAVIGALIGTVLLAGIMRTFDHGALALTREDPSHTLRYFIGWCIPGVAIAIVLVVIGDGNAEEVSKKQNEPRD